MVHRATKRIAAIALLSAFAASVSAHPPGRFTGGGLLTCEYGGATYKVTFGYTLHCKTDGTTAPPEPNNLQINFSHGDHFHLTDLSAAECSPPPTTTPTASISSITGSGDGRFNAQPATVNFTITDVAEPGRLDTVSLTITSGGGTVLACSGTLGGGNNQAHNATGSKQ